MKLFKREYGESIQIFKILEKIQPNDGEYFYRYISIIVNPLEIKQMDDYLSEGDYNHIQRSYSEIQNEDLETILSSRIFVSDKNKTYQYHLEKYLTYFKAKTKAKDEADKQVKENGGDFYDILVTKWHENNVYDLHSEVLILRGFSKMSRNLLEQYICDKAFKDANLRYLIRNL
jgi:hypothetical protein